MNRRNFIKNALLGFVAAPLLAREITNLSSTSPEYFGEWDRCANDPVYFIENYVKLSGPNGEEPFKLYPFQRTVIRDMHESNRYIAIKARQMGLTSLSVSYALWVTTFKPNQTVLFVVTKQVERDRTMHMFRFAYERLPGWMKGPLVKDNRFCIITKNGSKFSTVSSGELGMGGRSETINVAIVDEAAWHAREGWEHEREIMEHLIHPAGKFIAYSSRNPENSAFEDYADKFPATKVLKWHLHPHRNAAWRKSTEDMIGKINFYIEFNCI